MYFVEYIFPDGYTSDGTMKQVPTVGLTYGEHHRVAKVLYMGIIEDADNLEGYRCILEEK